MPSPWEFITGGFLGDLNPLDGIDGGEFLGFDDGTGDPIYRALQVSHVGEPYVPKVPLAPFLTLTTPQPTRTTSAGSWTLTNTGRPPITAWEIERAVSTNDGASFGAYAPISTSPQSPTPQTFAESGLSTGTPEHIFRYRVRGVNADGEGAWSNEASTQFDATPPTPPTAPTGLFVDQITATSARLNWTETPDPTVTKHQLWRFTSPGTLLVDNIDPTADSFVWTGLTEGVVQNNVNVRRVNPDGTSPASNVVTFTPTAPSNFVFDPLIGCSNSQETHGGTDDWDSWRVYAFNSGNDGGAITIASRTGATHPVRIALTDNGNGAGGIITSYNTAFNLYSDWLDEFYYTTPGGSTLHPVRGDVQLAIANGNEYGADVTSGNLAGFVNGCRGIYDATRTLNPNGSRRYPLAESWIDPTHFQEQNTILDAEDGTNLIDVPLSESAFQATPYLDGIAWSLYPPGRDSTLADPTWEWPIFDPDFARDPAIGHQPRLQRAYLIRCWMRTYEAQFPTAQAPGSFTGNPYITSFHPLKIACWEIGSGNDPDDQTTRPFWAAHIIASCGRLCEQYGLEMADFHWWDNSIGGGENILTDEQAATGTQISTRVALQNWQQYDHFGIGHPDGTHPSAWAGNPKTTWKNRQTSWLTQWQTDMNTPV